MSESRDALMATLVEMGYSPAHAAAYSLRYPTIESALEHLMAAEASGQLNEQAAAQQPPPFTPLSPPPEERKEPNAVLQVATPGVWHPLRRSSLGGGSINAPVVFDDSETTTAGGTEEEELALQLMTSCHAAPTAHTHLLQQWNHSTLLVAFKGSRSNSVCNETASHTANCTTAPPPAVLSESTATSTGASDSPSLQPVQLTSSVSATLTTLVIGESSSNSEATKGNPSLLHSSEGEEEEDACDVCFDAPKECLFLPCKHVSLCSGCCSAYFLRTAEYNAVAATVRAAAQEEAARAREPRFAQGARSVSAKNADRIVACPCCSQTVHCAIRKSSSGSSRTTSAASSRRASNAAADAAVTATQ